MGGLRSLRKLLKRLQARDMSLAPFALGGLHALVALNSLGRLLLVNVVGYSLVVVGLFAAVQLAFMALTRWTYLRALLPGR